MEKVNKTYSWQKIEPSQRKKDHIEIAAKEAVKKKREEIANFQKEEAVLARWNEMQKKKEKVIDTEKRSDTIREEEKPKNDILPENMKPLQKYLYTTVYRYTSMAEVIDVVDGALEQLKKAERAKKQAIGTGDEHNTSNLEKRERFGQYIQSRKLKLSEDLVLLDEFHDAMEKKSKGSGLNPRLGEQSSLLESIEYIHQLHVLESMEELGVEKWMKEMKEKDSALVEDVENEMDNIKKKKEAMKRRIQEKREQRLKNKNTLEEKSGQET